MNKLLGAVVAGALCSAVYGIESANIVGYAQADIDMAGLTAGSCFIPVSGKTIDLTELKVVGYEEATEGDVNVQTLDEFGRTVANYAYYDVPGELTGWLDNDDNEVEPGQVTIQAGEGLWTYTTEEGLAIQSAGQVATDDVAVNLDVAGLSVVNPTPVAVDLTDCYVSGYEEATEGDLNVQTLDEFGRTVANYAYYDVPGELTGWLDNDDNEIEVGDVVIKPGQGLWSYTSADGLSFVWPGVKLVK